MVDRHERDVVEEVRLPELGRDPYVVEAVAGRQPVAGNPDPVLAVDHRRRALRVDAQPERGAPEEVRDETHALAVVCEDPRARALEPLPRHRRLIVAGDVELGLHASVRPYDARDIEARVLAQAEVGGG